FAKETVPVEALEDFLKAEPEALAKLFDEYYSWLESRKSKRFSRMTFDAKSPTLEAFLRAARLNPSAKFPLVERILPGQKAGAAVPLEKISPYLKDVPPLLTEFKDAAGAKMTIRAVLYSFADEPDWGMDHSLWGFKEYGYGPQPYGNPEGESSKA